MKAINFDIEDAEMIEAVKTTALESNYFLEAIKNYTPEMIDVLYLCLSATRPQLTNSKYYDKGGETKFIPDYIIKEELGKARISEKSFRMTCKKLAETVLDLDYVDGWGYRPAFRRIDYHHGEGLLYMWNPDVEPYVLRFEKNYSEVTCKLIYKMGRDKWAKRIIEQVSQWHWKFHNGREYRYDELRNLMGVTEKEFAGAKGKQNFLLKLKKAAKSITEETPYTVAITTEKKDRLHPRIVTHYFIRWDIDQAVNGTIDAQATELKSESHTEAHSAPQKHAEATTLQEQSTPMQKPAETKQEALTGKPDMTPVNLSSFPETERECLKRMIGKPYHLDPDVAKAFMKNSGLVYCQKQMEYVRKSGNSRNLGGYLRNALEFDFAGSRERNIEAKQAEEAEHADKEAWNKQADEFFHGKPAPAHAQAAEEPTSAKTMPPSDPKAKPLWDSMLTAIHANGLSPSAIDKWLGDCVPTSIENGTLTITSPNDFIKDWVKSHYIKDLAKNAAANGIDHVEIISNG